MFRRLLLVVFLLESVANSSELNSVSAPDADSVNFKVRSYHGGPPASDILKQCEQLRLEYRRLWLGKDVQEEWVPRCELVLHKTRASYFQAVGRNSGQSSGSSLIQFDKDDIVARRIDLAVDQFGRITALPHELTHVVLADRFAGRQPPRWFDEGIATMADSAEKRSLHHRDCCAAVRSGRFMRLIDVFQLDDFSTAEQVPAFYGQSLSLVAFLAEKGEPRVIVEFVEAAMARGYDRALQECYDIENVGELERDWLEYVRNKSSSQATVSTARQPQRQIRFP